MKYVRFHYDCGYVGCDNEEYIEFEDGEYSDWDLDVMCNEGAEMNAEQFAYQISFDSEEDEEDYYEDARNDSYWEYITEEEYMENAYEK